MKDYANKGWLGDISDLIFAARAKAKRHGAEDTKAQEWRERAEAMLQDAPAWVTQATRDKAAKLLARTE